MPNIFNESKTIQKPKINTCWFCGHKYDKIIKYIGLGYLCNICIQKIKHFQMY